MIAWEEITDHITKVLEDLIAAGNLKPQQVIVIGASTSEITGQLIGTAGVKTAAEAIFNAARSIRDRFGIYAAFQCCEHLNRALVVEREAMERYGWEEVSVKPIPGAGGSMAAYAFEHLEHSCVVDYIQAHAGIDIGATLIGMHLRRVAVPFRPTIRQIGSASITAAYTRPRLIGGARAQYGGPTCS